MEPSNVSNSRNFSLVVRVVVVMVLLFVMLGWLSFRSVSDEPAATMETAVTPTAAVKSPDDPVVLTAQAAELANAQATAVAQRDIEQELRYQNLPGRYDIRGTNPISGTYNGQLTISEVGSYHNVEWIINSQIITGTGLLYSDTFAVSWGDPNCKAIVYQIREDGQLGGAWYLLSQPNEYGLEVVDPLDDGSENFIVGGTRRVFGMNTEGERYYGSVEFAVNGSVYTADWQFDGGDISATGVQKDDILSFGWGDENCSVAAYTVNDDGTLDGVWTDVGEMWLGTEIGEKIN